MLKKIIGGIIGLVLAGFGIALMGGWLDPSELDEEGGSRRSRSFKRIIGWLSETLGATGAGIVVLVAGALVVFFAMRPEKPEAAGDAE